MEVNACNIVKNAAVKTKGTGSKLSQDSFQAFLQILLGGFLNTGNAPAQGSPLPGNKEQNTNDTADTGGLSKISDSSLTCSSGSMGDAVSVLNQPVNGFLQDVISGLQDGAADLQVGLNTGSDSKGQAAQSGKMGKDVQGIEASNSKGAMNDENPAPQVMKEIKLFPGMNGAKDITPDAGSKGLNLKGSQTDSLASAAEKAIMQQADAIKSERTITTAAVQNLSKPGDRELSKETENAKPASSAGHNEGSPLFQECAVSKELPGQADAVQAASADSSKQPLPVSKDDILNQVYGRIKVLNGNNMSELHVSLKPDQLGDVSIKLVMEKGTINARITVENSNIKNIMETSMSQIKEHLKDQNVNVSHLSVYVGTGQTESGGGSSPRQYKWQHSRVNRPGQDESDTKIQESRYRGGALDLLA